MFIGELLRRYKNLLDLVWVGYNDEVHDPGLDLDWAPPSQVSMIPDLVRTWKEDGAHIHCSLDKASSVPCHTEEMAQENVPVWNDWCTSQYFALTVPREGLLESQGGYCVCKDR